MWKCLECGRKFRTTNAAERAANNGCPGCGGVDIDLDVEKRSEDNNVDERLKRIFLQRKPKEDKQ
jgi:predicted  nucleic acid-binding Zn-ribbon protein